MIPYGRLEWHHHHENNDLMRKAICGFNWKRASANKDMFMKLFSENISNVLSSYIHHDTVNFDDQDPPWIVNKNKKSCWREKWILSRPTYSKGNYSEKAALYVKPIW